MSRLMKNAFAISVPPRNPHVSRLANVFRCAIRKKVVRKVGGKNTVRSGVPFSRYAAGANVCVASGVAIRAGGCCDTFSGRGGSASMLILGFGGRAGGRSAKFPVVVCCGIKGNWGLNVPGSACCDGMLG